MSTRIDVQNTAYKSLKDNFFNGTIIMDTGTGKSKVIVDIIKNESFNNILILKPRTNLTINWENELIKWYPEYINKKIDILNIQTAYKWGTEEIINYDYIVMDECHTIGENYISIFEKAKKLNIPCTLITATSNEDNFFKKTVLYKMFPILYRFNNAEDDGLVNKVNYIVYEHELSNDYKVLTGTKTNKWWIGEKAQYEYLTEKYNYAKRLMFAEGASDYWNNALIWMKNGTTSQKKAGTEFFRAVNNRKNFLWNLTSTTEIAIRLKHKVLEKKSFRKDGIVCNTQMLPTIYYANKVLLFSELTPQASKLSSNVIHSNVGKTAKITQQLNEETLRKFNNGEIRDLASVKSLTLGLNMVGVNWAIFESYSGSDVQGAQKNGRLHRLNVNEVANVIIIVVKGTQGETWYNSAFPFVKNPRIIKSIDEL